MSTEIKPGQVWAWDAAYDSREAQLAVLGVSDTYVEYRHVDLPEEPDKHDRIEWFTTRAHLVTDAAPSLPTQASDDDGREAAPLDPSKVKAGDTVTLENGETSVRGPVAHIEKALPMDVVLGFSIRNVGWRYIAPGVVAQQEHGVWTLTSHQPAPEPEPEWELEQVAEISFRGCHAAPLTTLRAIRTDASWRTANGDWSDVNVESVRPLVVIDPAAVSADDLRAAIARALQPDSDLAESGVPRKIAHAVRTYLGLDGAS